MLKYRNPQPLPEQNGYILSPATNYKQNSEYDPNQHDNISPRTFIIQKINKLESMNLHLILSSNLFFS